MNGSLDPTKNNGNVQSQTITVPGMTSPFVQTYTYDELNRLQSAEETVNATSNWKQVYTYDRFGNRTLAAGTTLPNALNDTNNPSISQTDNRITSAGYSYDAAGNLLCDPAHPCAQTPFTPYYDYNAENKMKSAGGGVANGGTSYTYDGDGRRVRKATANGETVVFVYNAMGQMVAEYSNMQSAGGTSYLTSDTLGSTRAVTAQDKSVKSRHDYLPFGEEIGAGVGGRTTNQGYSAFDGVRMKFTGAERDDETGLDFMQARYYANTQGRFTSVDPFSIILHRQKAPNDEKSETAFREFLGSPQRWNRYAYAVNAPTVFTDPTGLDIMIIENHATKGNPTGHTAIAITGRGVFSMGNAQGEKQSDDKNNILGGGVKDYILREIPGRDTTIVIIKTTPEQDAAAAAKLKEIAGSRDQLESDTTILRDNCTARVNEALDAAGIQSVNNGFLPGSAGARAVVDGGLSGMATVIEVPQNSNLLLTDSNAIQQFEPRRNSYIPPPGTPGGTPVVTMPAPTRTTRRRNDE